MSRFDAFTDRALDLANSAGDGLRQMVPNGAGGWLQTGAAIGALKGGARVASGFVRRHPAVVITTAAGAGLLWYAARRKAQQAREAPIDGHVKRVEARRAEPSARSSRAPSGQARGAAKTPSSQ